VRAAVGAVLLPRVVPVRVQVRAQVRAQVVWVMWAVWVVWVVPGGVMVYLSAAAKKARA
jgi:hypothetical protein